MASLMDILIEMNDAIAKEQLNNIETSVEKVSKETEEKNKLLKAIPNQVQGLKDYLEQQKQNGVDTQKDLGKGIGTSISLKKPGVTPYLSNQLKPVGTQQPEKDLAQVVPEAKPPVSGQALKPATAAKTSSVADILKTRKI